MLNDIQVGIDARILARWLLPFSCPLTKVAARQHHISILKYYLSCDTGFQELNKKMKKRDEKMRKEKRRREKKRRKKERRKKNIKKKSPR